jgi:hypothetical protein
MRVVALSAAIWAGVGTIGAGTVLAQEEQPPTSVPVGEWEGAQVAMSAPAPPPPVVDDVDTGSVPETEPQVASLSPAAAPAPRSVSAAPAQLPATGGELDLALVALAALGAGLTMRRLARRPA